MAKSLATASPDLPKEKPTIRLDENDCPDVKNWKMDQEVTVTVTAKVSGLNRDDWREDKRVWATLQILKVESEKTDDAIAKGMDSVKVSKVARK